MPHLTVNGQPLFYFERRVPASPIPPVVLIHGAGGTHLDWPPQLRRLPGVSIVALDLPGHGRSGSVGRDTVAAYAADVLTVLDALELNAAVLMGHSMGAAIALQGALDAPGRVAGLVLIGAGARMRVNPMLLEAALNDMGKAVQFVMACGYSPDTDSKLKHLGEQGLRSMTPVVLHGDYLACNGFDVRARLGEIGVPALVVGGGADQMMPIRFAEELAAGLPGADLRRMENVGHMMQVEAPERLAEIVRAWLKEHWAE
jgi:pimeloyl-ACP methyl ester carboxylesterase